MTPFPSMTLGAFNSTCFARYFARSMQYEYRGYPHWKVMLQRGFAHMYMFSWSSTKSLFFVKVENSPMMPLIYAYFFFKLDMMSYNCGGTRIFHRRFVLYMWQFRANKLTSIEGLSALGAVLTQPIGPSSPARTISAIQYHIIHTTANKAKALSKCKQTSPKYARQLRVLWLYQVVGGQFSSLVIDSQPAILYTACSCVMVHSLLSYLRSQPRGNERYLVLAFYAYKIVVQGRIRTCI